MNKEVKAFADHYKLLDDLIAEEAPPPLLDDDITVARLAERAKCGHTKATRILERWATEGKVEFIGLRRVTHGNKVKAWRLKGKA